MHCVLERYSQWKISGRYCADGLEEGRTLLVLFFVRRLSCLGRLGSAKLSIEANNQRYSSYSRLTVVSPPMLLLLSM
eukprot:COSAG02_NODE_11915_length_1631_cov_1.201044_2_plen_77_part_00